MTSVFEGFNRLAATWAELVWAVTWQSTFLVGVLAVVVLALRRSSPGLRYWIWQIAAIKLLLMPLWSLSITQPARPQHDAEARAAAWPLARSGVAIGARLSDGRRPFDDDATPHGRRSATPDGWLGKLPFNWQAWLFLGWGLAVACQVAAIAHQRGRLERVRRQAAPAADAALLDLVAELAGRIGLRRPPEVRIAGCAGSPFVCGLRRPTLMLPPGLAHSVHPQALRAILLHELAHIRRRDLLWDWIAAGARLLYFFHPAAHYIASCARLERELACDQVAMVLARQGAASYASTLVEIVSRSSVSPALRAALASAGIDGSEAGPAPSPAVEIARFVPPIEE
jgi:beta-lactamase regulating signal transducer with metallopeptidase domain